MPITSYQITQDYRICTSSTRPSSPYAGLSIYETDTNRMYIYTGSAWYYLSGGTDPTAFYGYQVTTSTSITAGATGVKIDLQTEQYDYGSNFNTTTSTYTVPRNGMLDLRWGMSVTALSDGQRFFSSIYVNGSEITRGTDLVSGGAAQTMQSTGATQWPVTAGDTAVLWGVVLTTTRTTVPGWMVTFMTGRMIP